MSTPRFLTLKMSGRARLAARKRPLSFIIADFQGKRKGKMGPTLKISRRRPFRRPVREMLEIGVSAQGKPLAQQTEGGGAGRRALPGK
jgi:hypothetical protein